MVGTDSLIRSLARDAAPVRRLPPPHRRVARWLALALPVIALFGIIIGARPDLTYRAVEPAFFVPLLAALATAVCAAHAAFSSCVPGSAKWTLWLPAAPVAVWIGSLGRQCWQDWLTLGPEGVTFSPDPICLPIIAAVGAMPTIAMVAMVRRGAPLTPRLTAFLGALAAAALAYVGLRLVHPQDAAFLVLVWQFGSVGLFAAVVGAFGRRLLSWRRIAAA
ncbi:MAG: NrsF family protein [Rhodospirillales bacterium]